jgi:hypothetical protein
VGLVVLSKGVTDRVLRHLLVFFSLSNTLEILIDEKDEIKGQEILRLLASSCLDQCAAACSVGLTCLWVC